jgi:hypothetical protein
MRIPVGSQLPPAWRHSLAGFLIASGIARLVVRHMPIPHGWLLHHPTHAALVGAGSAALWSLGTQMILRITRPRNRSTSRIPTPIPVRPTDPPVLPDVIGSSGSQSR